MVTHPNGNASANQGAATVSYQLPCDECDWHALEAEQQGREAPTVHAAAVQVHGVAGRDGRPSVVFQPLTHLCLGCYWLKMREAAETGLRLVADPLPGKVSPQAVRDVGGAAVRAAADASGAADELAAAAIGG